ISHFFFFSSRRRHTRSKRDWSSDVCSSDLLELLVVERHRLVEVLRVHVPVHGGLAALSTLDPDVDLFLVADHGDLFVAFCAPRGHTLITRGARTCLLLLVEALVRGPQAGVGTLEALVPACDVLLCGHGGAFLHLGLVTASFPGVEERPRCPSPGLFLSGLCFLGPALRGACLRRDRSVACEVVTDQRLVLRTESLVGIHLRGFLDGG